MKQQLELIINKDFLNNKSPLLQKLKKSLQMKVWLINMLKNPKHQLKTYLILLETNKSLKNLNLETCLAKEILWWDSKKINKKLKPIQNLMPLKLAYRISLKIIKILIQLMMIWSWWDSNLIPKNLNLILKSMLVWITLDQLILITLIS